MRTNQWFTSAGKDKKIPSDLETYRPLISRYSGHGSIDNIQTILNIRQRFLHLGLADATNLFVFINGVIERDENSMFRKERFDAGKQIHESLKGVTGATEN